MGANKLGMRSAKVEALRRQGEFTAGEMWSRLGIPTEQVARARRRGEITPRIVDVPGRRPVHFYTREQAERMMVLALRGKAVSRKRFGRIMTAVRRNEATAAIGRPLTCSRCERVALYRDPKSGDGWCKQHRPMVATHV